MDNDLKSAYGALIKQAGKARAYQKYYLGDQPLMYTHERLRQVFERSSVTSCRIGAQW